MPDPKQHLRAAELALYNSEVFMPSQEEKRILENLAACRALLEKHEYVDYVCPECKRNEYGPIKRQPHKPDCAIAAQLAGIGGK